MDYILITLVTTYSCSTTPKLVGIFAHRRRTTVADVLFVYPILRGSSLHHAEIGRVSLTPSWTTSWTSSLLPCS